MSECKSCMGKSIKAAITAAQPEVTPTLAMIPTCPNDKGIKFCILGKAVDFHSGNPGKSAKLPKGKCKPVGEFVHCQIKNKDHFDPRSFRTVSPNEDVRITIGCPKGEWSGKKCRVGTEAQRIMYREEACGDYEGCKVRNSLGR